MNSDTPDIHKIDQRQSEFKIDVYSYAKMYNLMRRLNGQSYLRGFDEPEPEEDSPKINNSFSKTWLKKQHQTKLKELHFEFEEMVYIPPNISKLPLYNGGGPMYKELLQEFETMQKSI